MWNVVHTLIIATTSGTLKLGMWSGECGMLYTRWTQPQLVEHWSKECGVENVECCTHANHYTYTVNDVLFVIQLFKIWRRREAHLTCVAYFWRIPSFLDVTPCHCSSDLTEKCIIFIFNGSVDMSELFTEIKQIISNGTNSTLIPIVPIDRHTAVSKPLLQTRCIIEHSFSIPLTQQTPLI